MAVSLEDRLAIQQLIARYNATFDTGDAAAWAATFTEDGTMGGRRGRLAQQEYAQMRADERAAGPYAIIQHVTTNLVLAGDSERIDAFSYLQRVARRRDGSGFEILTVGFYVDVVLKVDGQWLFESRRLLDEEPPPRTRAASGLIRAGTRSRPRRCC